MAPNFRDVLKIAGRWTVPNLRHFYFSGQPVVWVLATLTGLATGVAAIIFRLAIGAVQLPWLETTSEHVAEAARAQPWWVIMLAPAIGGLLVGLILRYLLKAKRTGTASDVIEARITAGRNLTPGQGLFSALASAISLGAGASAGREGPIVHLGATISAAACRWFDLPRAARRTLLASGVAGAVAASFNAPIAGVLFAQEVILGHFAVTSFVPLVLASVTATIVSQAWFGDAAAFTVPAYQITSYLEVPAFVLLGAVAALVAVIFHACLLLTDWFARGFDIPLVLRPAAGGLMIGLIAVWFPEVLGVGYDTTDAALKNQLPIAMMFVLLIAKTAATSIALASRFGGGIFSPALYLGAMTGGAFGLIASSVFPEFGSSGGLYAILGMGAVAAALLGAPISTTVMVFELTGGYALSLALLLTVSVGNGLFQAIVGRSFFHAQLEARGVVLQEGPHRVVMKTVSVREFMQPLDEDAQEDVDPEKDLVVLRADDSLDVALRAFNETGLERLPVVDGTEKTKIIGTATQVKALSAFNKELIASSVEEHR